MDTMVSVFSDDYDFPRSWLLPVLRSNIQQTELGFFTQYFLPLAAKLRTRGTQHHYRYFKLCVFCNHLGGSVITKALLKGDTPSKTLLEGTHNKQFE